MPFSVERRRVAFTLRRLRKRCHSNARFRGTGLARHAPLPTFAKEERSVPGVRIVPERFAESSAWRTQALDTPPRLGE